MSANSPYFLGRPHKLFTSPYLGEDQTLAAERLDGKVIKSPEYRHCTFANLSFKNAEIFHGTFENCIFVGCYFRRTELRNCRFTGCRFFDCNFNHVVLKSCKFSYSTFHGCQIPYSEIQHCFPSEPNLCEDLARNLSVESSRMGLSREAIKFRRIQIEAHEKHLKAAFSGSTTWYREHFDFSRRVVAFLQWIASLFNRWVWGYGDRARMLVLNLAVLSLLVFPALFLLYREQLSGLPEEKITFLDTLLFSLENVIPAGIESELAAASMATRFLAGLESLFGVVALALFAAYVFRWSLHR